MSSSTSRPAARSGGLSYHDAAYWNERFLTDPRETLGFEWLASTTSLLTLLAPTLLLSPTPIRVLHIGVGTSKLSFELLRYWKEHSPGDWRERARGVVNVDFSPKSVEFQHALERGFMEECGLDEEEALMKYHVLDLLDWTEVRRVLGEKGQFDVVLDKSTTDSISTGEDTPFTSIPAASNQGRWHPSLAHLARSQMTGSKGEGGVATTQLLGINLGALVKKGGLWLCHSYSSSWWEDVIIPPDQPASWPWKEVAKTPVPVESADPNAPQINHYIYTLERT